MAMKQLENWIWLLLILVLIIMPHRLYAKLGGSVEEEAEYRPVVENEGQQLEVVMVRRKVLAPFQVCLVCKCCVNATPPTCLNMPCCFGINCHLPNKPFGVCAFVPNTCNCASCAQ